MSTGLNSMTGVILVDFIRPLRKKPLSEGQASFYMKIMVVVLGCIFVALAFAVDRLGGLIQVISIFFLATKEYVVNTAFRHPPVLPASLPVPFSVSSL